MENMITMINEKIKELSDIAYKNHITKNPNSSFGRRTDYDKEFAELIILETCNVLDKAQWDKGKDWVCADGTRIIPQIKKHFGIE